MKEIHLKDLFSGCPDHCERLVSCLQYCSEIRETVSSLKDEDSLYAVRTKNLQI